MTAEPETPLMLSARDLKDIVRLVQRAVRHEERYLQKPHVRARRAEVTGDADRILAGRRALIGRCQDALGKLAVLPAMDGR